MDEPTAQRRQGDRRRLWGRRSPDLRRALDDRRTRDRRAAIADAPAERRERSDRRGRDRRSVEDRRAPVDRRRGRRRRDTPTPFTAEQLVALRAKFATRGQVSCPACGGGFTFGPAIRRTTDTARRVMCRDCGRNAGIPHSYGSRILVVSANPALRDAMHGTLGHAGHEVIETADAGVALEAFRIAPVDVVLLDVEAPGRTDVLEFLRRLRRARPDARVLALAGRASHRGADPLALTRGVSDVRTLRVPASRDELLRAVELAAL